MPKTHATEREMTQTLKGLLRKHGSRITKVRAAAAAVAVAVVAAVVLVITAPEANLTAASPSPGAAEEGAPGDTDPAPSPDGEWAALELPPYEPLADLRPDAVDGSGISTDGSFTLHSLTSIPAVDLAAGLVTEPALSLEIAAGPSAELATVRPVGALAENARYRFLLHGPDGALAGEWSFRTGGPLHVVRRLPEDRSTQVPVDTGIEVEFDQDGVVDPASHFSIEPAVEGSFQAHGRTWVFIPKARLDPATLYTVTLTAGVGIDDSDQVLESDVQFAFETAGPDVALREPIVAFERPMHEVRSDEPPVIPVMVHGDPGEATTITRRVVVYALGTLDAAIDAAATLSVDRGWASWSSNGNVSTAGLTETAAFDVAIPVAWPGQNLQLPTGLAAGWYLLEVVQDGRAAQLLLQVTDLAAYVIVSQTTTVAWVNDLALDAPIAGAALALSDGSRLGQTDAAGLLEVASPPTLLAPYGDGGGPRTLIVSAPDGRTVVAPIAPESSWSWAQNAPSSRWWLLFGTDRLQYRQEDTIRVWGLVRSRIDRSVPTGLQLRLVTGGDLHGPPIAQLAVTASSRGVLVGELPVRDLPPGEYRVGLFVDGEAVSHASVSVTDIRKPAFRIDVTTDRRAYIHGDPIHVAAAATFYDGTGAPGLSLRVNASPVSGTDDEVVTAGASGVAEATFLAAASDGRMQSGSIHVAPAQPEEGSSSGSTSLVVFPSTVWLEAEATLDAGNLVLGGSLARVDLDAAGAQLAQTGRVDDPSGDALPGRQVSVEIDRVTWRPVQVGTIYDFLQKKTVPLLRYEDEVESLGAFTPTSAADGSFELTLPVELTGGAIIVRLSAADEEGRRVETVAHASTAVTSSGPPSAFPYLEARAGCGPAPTLTAGVGEGVSVTVRTGDGTPSAEGRTLFVVGRLGVDAVAITTGASLERVFSESDLPSLTVRAVRLSPAGYIVTNDAQIRVLGSDRAIEVALESDLARYAPGEDVTLTITTTGPDGAPIAADLIVQALDLKLFAIGAAREIDTRALMSPISSGFIGSYASHPIPPPPFDGGCGATTGGGEPRDDFEDLATFQLLQTGVDGRGSATFELPDDLTSWAVSATALGAGLEAGTSSIEIPVGLPFFVDATLAPEYLAGEEPILQLRAYGDALVAGEPVRFTIEAPSLGLTETAIEGSAFEPVRAALPALSLGDHDLTITAERPGAEPEMADSIVRTVRVVPTRLRTLQSSYDALTSTLAPSGGDGLTTYVVTDAGRGSLLAVLQQLTWSASARFDASLAAAVARQMLIDDFGMAESSLPASGFTGAFGHPPEGLALLPYASADLYLTARTALVAPEQASTGHLANALRMELDRGSSSRERRIVALAGLAGLGNDVLAELRAFEAEDLTVRERLWLALGLQASGDQDAARAIERSILSEHGQRLGPWVRLDAGSTTPEAAEVSASMLLLAAGLRDPVAADISRYLRDNPSPEYLAVLEQLGYARAAIEWLPREEARFAWTVDGERHEETLERGGAFILTLTAGQRQTLLLERLEGDLLVASTWVGEAQYDALPDDSAVTIERVVTPADHAPTDDLVRVRLNVTIDGGAPRGCYQVTDLVPSGLSPVIVPGYGFAEQDATVIPPYEVEGQRVSWCIGTDRRTLQLGYSARVVSAGTFRWEPAVIQSMAARSVGAATPLATYTID